MFLMSDYSVNGMEVDGLLATRAGATTRSMSPLSLIQLTQVPSASNDSEILVILLKLIYVWMQIDYAIQWLCMIELGMLLNKLNLFMKRNFENEMCILMNDRA